MLNQNPFFVHSFALQPYSAYNTSDLYICNAKHLIMFFLLTAGLIALHSLHITRCNVGKQPLWWWESQEAHYLESICAFLLALHHGHGCYCFENGSVIVHRTPLCLAFPCRTNEFTLTTHATRFQLDTPMSGLQEASSGSCKTWRLHGHLFK